MDTPSRDLSGGEKARLLLGLATFGGPNLMILDEPTNHLDIDSREALVVALAEYSGAVIVISHDRHLLEASVDRLWLVADGTVRPFDGDLDDYRRMVLEARSGGGSEPAAKTDANAAQQRRRQAARRREETAPLRRKIRDAEAEIERLRKEIAKVDQRLADGAIYVRDPAEATRLAKSRADAAKAMAAAEDTWLELSGALEAAMAD
jgi:ATP-binding cassette subfamily F protein 3